MESTCCTKYMYTCWLLYTQSTNYTCCLEYLRRTKYTCWLQYTRCMVACAYHVGTGGTTGGKGTYMVTGLNLAATPGAVGLYADGTGARLARAGERQGDKLL